MRNHCFARLAFGAMAFALGVAPAMAGGAVTFVSGKGVDAGACATPAKPCRTFAYALTQTNPVGEIKTLDPADYGVVAIDKSITITGVPGASIEMTAAGVAIGIAGAGATVSLRGLEINGQGVGTRGVVVAAAKAVNIVDCVVRRMTADGLYFGPSSGSVSATISNTISSDNGAHGVYLVAGSNASVIATIDHVTTNDNTTSGVWVAPHATATIADSIAENNGHAGYAAAGSEVIKLSLARSVAAFNGNGVLVAVAPTVTAKSFGDNKIYANGTNVSGPLATVPPH